MKTNISRIFFHFRKFQIEATGISELQLIEDLEILFVSCDEIGSLEECRSLKRLSRKLILLDYYVFFMLKCFSFG